MFHQDEKKNITWSGPNKGPIVWHLLHLVFCNGPALIADPNRFKSSMETMPQAVKKEVPMPMVTLVGAVVRTSKSP